MSDSFGKKVRDLRISKGYTLEELANKLRTKKNYVWQLENKSPARPSGQLLLRIADILEVSPDFLIDDDVVEETEDQLADALFRKSKDRGLSKNDIEKIFQIMDIMDDKV